MERAVVAVVVVAVAVVVAWNAHLVIIITMCWRQLFNVDLFPLRKIIKTAFQLFWLLLLMLWLMF